MTSREARSVYRRSFAAFAGWSLLCALLAVIAVAIGVRGLLGRIEDPGAAALAGAGVAWLAGWVWLCAWVVWTYRRQVPDLAAAASSYEPSTTAARHAQVAMQFTLRDLTGVELHGLRPTRAARFVNGQWPLVGHAAAIGLLVIAAVWS